MISPHFLGFNFKKINLACRRMLRSFFDNISFTTVTFEVIVILLFITGFIDRRENSLPGEKYDFAARLPKR